MNRVNRPHLAWPATLAALLLCSTILPAQETKTNFFDVQVSKDEIYKYVDLRFTGDYTTFESPSGFVALGKTEGGVTIVIIVGDGTMNIEAPEAGREKFKTIFGSYPLKTTFKSVYMRLNPKEFEETFGKMQLSKSPDEGVLTKAKELYDLKFLASYHAGPKAIFPPYKTRVLEVETTDHGQITNEEGYWLILRRLSPYGSVYPSRFVNPKQR